MSQNQLSISTRFLLPFCLALLIVFSSTSGITAAEDSWTEDAKKAIAQAKKEDKDLVLLFTGSDWCPPCKKLEAEVLGQEDFQIEATTTLVLVKFDFPQEKRLDAKTVTQNKEFREKFGVEGYPTVVFTGTELKPVGITGYQEGGIPNYLAVLEGFRELRVKRDENLKKAAELKGLERAKALDAAVNGIAEGIVQIYYPEIIEEIIALDKDDELGLKSKYNASKEAEMRKVILTDIQMIAELEKPEKAIGFIDEVAKEIEFSSAEQLSIMQIKLNLIRKMNNVEMMDEILDEMINLEGVEGETRERLIVKKILLMVGTERRPAAVKLLEDSFQAGERNLHLRLCKAQLQVANKEFEPALVMINEAIEMSKSAPDMMVEFVGGKADIMYEMKDPQGALQLLDNFAENKDWPSDLRSEAMLQKAMMMHDMGRPRQARLAENSAIEIAESADERTEVQKMVERLRKNNESKKD